MPPLTLAILATVLQVEGADATISSDNKGIEDLLADIRGQLESQVAPGALVNTPAAYHKNKYYRTYDRVFIKSMR
jgi:hypothetical protein